MPMSNNLKHWTFILVTVLVLGALWQQVFSMTGVLWWDAPRLEKPIPRPVPPRIAPPPTDWVDLKAYLRTHPVWTP